MTNFPTWWAFCQAPDRDGHAADGPGTRWGFIYPTFVDAVSYVAGPNGDTSIAAFDAATQANMEVLAQSYFWDRLGGRTLKTGVDVSFIDFCWTSGGATRLVQTNVGVYADGIVGPLTIAAINKHPTFVQDINVWRKAYYDGLGFRSLYPGLYARADDILAVAKALIAGTPPDVNA